MKKQKFTKEQIREWMLDSAAANGTTIEIHSFFDENGVREDFWRIVHPLTAEIIATEREFREDMERGWH